MSESATNEKKTYHHGDLYKVLLDEAARLLREEGEEGLSMRKLAAITGVSRTAPYHHFRDKQGLLCAIAEEGFRRFRAVIERLGADTGQPLSEARIVRFVDDYIEFATEHSEYYNLMLGSQLWKRDGLTESLKREAQGTFRAYVDSIRQWQKQGEVSEALDSQGYAQVTWSTLHGMSRLLIDGIYVDRAARNSMCAATAAMFWRELSAR